MILRLLFNRFVAVSQVKDFDINGRCNVLLKIFLANLSLLVARQQ